MCLLFGYPFPPSQNVIYEPSLLLFLDVVEHVDVLLEAAGAPLAAAAVGHGAARTRTGEYRACSHAHRPVVYRFGLVLRQIRFLFDSDSGSLTHFGFFLGITYGVEDQKNRKNNKKNQFLIQNQIVNQELGIHND